MLRYYHNQERETRNLALRDRDTCAKFLQELFSYHGNDRLISRNNKMLLEYLTCGRSFKEIADKYETSSANVSKVVMAPFLHKAAETLKDRFP
jgi:uncharacterized protein YerC